MSDYRRWRIAGGTYFFTQVTYLRRPFLTSPNARRCLREAFRRVRKLRPFEVVALAVMPDHFHTVWRLPPGDTDYSTRWRQLKTLFSRAYDPGTPVAVDRTASRLTRHEKDIWQRRFYEHTCRDEDDLKRCVDYVHFNPVKHRIVNRVRDWRWSSFRRFVRLGEYGIDWASDLPPDFGDGFEFAE